MREAVFLVVTTLLHISSQKEVLIHNNKCRVCNFLVATFNEGLQKTAGQHFAGGDTAWEEKNLGKYATSETRLIEVMEGVCKKRTLQNTDPWSGIDNLEFKCSTVMESEEELIEEYYKKQQSRNMSEWLCIEQLKECCKDGHYGKNCEQCPGLVEGFSTCFGRGSCHGDGSRQGSGICKCDEGYMGRMCRKCAATHFEEFSTDSSITCTKCHQACSGGCKDGSSSSCTACRAGWQMEDGVCKDVNECDNVSACTRDNEVCVNTEGSFLCHCNDGYKRTGEECLLDIEAPSPRMFMPPDALLRTVSMASLVGIITLVVWRRSVFLAILTTVAVVLMILIDLNVNSDTIPDEARRILGQQ